MAWTDIRYRCGHRDRIQMYGPGRDRDARIWAYGQRLCSACWRELMNARADKPATPIAIFRRSTASEGELIISRAWDCWAPLMVRGYRMREEEDERQDPLAPWWQPRMGKVWVRTVTPAELEEEIDWLKNTVGARFPQLEPKKPATAPVIPRAFKRIEMSPGAHERIAVASDTIRKALRGAKKPYIAFSGGKDSTVVMALVHSIRPEAPVIWSDDELEYPETVSLMMASQARLGALFRSTLGFATHAGWFVPWSDRPFWREPLPGAERIGMSMEEWAQQEGYDLTFLGLRGDESRNRASFLAVAGPNYRRTTGRVSCPIWNWSDEDVFAFLGMGTIPYNAAYDRFEAMDLPLELRRVGPLPLCPRLTLAVGWPDLLAGLESRYGPRWG